MIKINETILQTMPRIKTIDLTQFPQSTVTQTLTPCPLLELNPNTSFLSAPTHPKNSLKSTLFNKKAFYLKLQRAQLDHCCIDIVNRKNTTTIAETSTSCTYKKKSHIQMLKKQIQYLEEDTLKWQKFPKASIPLKDTQTVNPNTEPTQQLNLHSIEQIVAENNKSILLKSLYQTFNRNFFIAPISNKTLTSDQKRAKRYLSAGRKKTYRKYTLQSTKNSGFNKQNQQRTTIHSNLQLSLPNQKYFTATRTRKNSSCTSQSSQIAGKTLKQYAHLPFTTVQTF